MNVFGTFHGPHSFPFWVYEGGGAFWANSQFLENGSQSNKHAIFDNQEKDENAENSAVLINKHVLGKYLANKMAYPP